MTMRWFDGTAEAPGEEMTWFDGTAGDPGVLMLWDPTGEPLAPAVSPFDWLEIEIDRCALFYGSAPCRAALGVTGEHPCFNGIATCQDPENYAPAPYWVRFAEPVADLPRLPGFADDGVPWFLPLLERVRHTPVKPDPGRSIGVRADLRATLRDAPYHDRGLDKYAGAGLLFADSWTGDDEQPWAPKWPNIEATGSASATIQGNKGRISLPSGSDWLVRMDAAAGLLADFDLTFTIQLGTTGAQFHNVLFRADDWVGDPVAGPGLADDPLNGYGLSIDGDSDGFHLRRLDAGERELIASVAKSWGAALWHIRLQATGPAIKARAWQGAEPASWDIEVDDAVHASGGLKLAFINGEEAAHTVDLDDLVITVPNRRDFDGADRSTLWLKLLTRHPHYVGRRMRWRRGEVTRHYVMERIDGPDRRGQIEITAKDPLKLADDDRAQAPKPSQGQLVLEMADDDAPTFIDVQTPDTAEYPAGGGIVFIGSEGFTYASAAAEDETTVRLSGISRSLPGAYATEADGHEAGDTVQLALYYEAERLVDIVADLLVGYVPRFDPAWIDAAAWSLEHDTWLAGLTLTRLIHEPEGVRKLIDEIVEQTLTWAFWWDEGGQTVRYRATRPPDFDEPVAELSDDATLIAGTVERIDEPERVVNIVQVVYGQIDPTADREDRENYRRVAIRADLDSLSTQQLGQQRIRQIFARWHPAGNSVFVDQFTTRTLAAEAAKSYRLEFAVTRQDGEALRLADFVEVDTHWIIDALGLPLPTRLQLIHASADGDAVRLRARRDVFSTVRAFGRIAPGHLNQPGYFFATASDLDRARYVFLADAAGLLSDGSEGYRLL